MSKLKALVLALVLLPSFAFAQGTENFAEGDKLLNRILPFLTPTTPVAVTVMLDNGVRHGEFMFGGKSATTTTDLMGVANNVANAIRAQFAIPPEYIWTALQGGPMERKLVQPVGSDGWRTIGFGLTIDGVPLEGSGLGVTFDATGRTRVISGQIPRLRPEIVAAVRGPRIPPLNAVVVMKFDAAGQPAGNPFGFTPGDTSVTLFGFQLMATPTSPFITYSAYLKSAFYTVSAVDGAIIRRDLMMTP